MVAHSTQWNMLTDPWLKVADLRGCSSRRSPFHVLANASTYHRLAASSPLDEFAGMRFLVTLLSWKAEVVGGVAVLRRSLLEGSMPEDLLSALRDEEDQFHLFDPHHPFFQDAGLQGTPERDRKSVGELFSECAVGTAIAHFHHGSDEEMTLCLPCVAMGLARVVPWTQSGGQGKTPSLHGAPPITAIVHGETLLQSLGRNLVDGPWERGEAQWTGTFSPSIGQGAVPFLEAMTWSPRRLSLPLPRTISRCWMCGATDTPGVSKIVYMKNDNTKKPSSGEWTWREPAAFYDTSKEEAATLKSSKEFLAADGRDLRKLCADDAPFASRVCSPDGGEALDLVVPCTNPANNKTFDHRRVELESLTPEDLQQHIAARPCTDVIKPRPVDGWRRRLPLASREQWNVTLRFLDRANRELSVVEWSSLANAANRPMEDAPAAFDVFSGLFWSFGAKGHLPDRSVLWLTLKLMASVSPRFRRLVPEEGFLPTDALPTRQHLSRASKKVAVYPVAFPRGPRLEKELREAVQHHCRTIHAKPIDWVRLCIQLDGLLHH